jgi:hypothetical protein
MDKIKLAAWLNLLGVGTSFAQTLPQLNQNPTLPLNSHNTLVFCTQSGVPYACNSNDFVGGGGGSGTVTDIVTGLGLTGGPITTAGTISLLSNSMTFGGQVVNLGASANVQGTAGAIQLGTAGASGDCAKFDTNLNITSTGAPCSTANGTVTSVVPGLGLTGGTITTAGTISMLSNTMQFGTQTVTLGALAAVQGSSGLIQLGSGTPTSGHCASFDSNHNIVDAGGACTTGGGGGTVTTGAANELAYYTSATNVVTGLATASNGILVTSGSGVPSITAAGTGVLTALTNPTVGTGDLVLAASPSTTINTVACTLGSTCSITAVAGSINSGTTSVLNATNGNLLYNNSGVLGNESLTSLLTSPPIIGGTGPNAGNFTTLSATGLITPSQTNGIKGTTTNNSANSGSVGEYISSSASLTAINLVDNTYTDITTVSLTAGDWDCDGSVGFNVTGTSSVVSDNLGGWISTTSATPPTSLTGGYAQIVPNGYWTSNTGSLIALLATGRERILLSSTTTVYLSALAGFTAGSGVSIGGGGFIGCRRVR